MKLLMIMMLVAGTALAQMGSTTGTTGNLSDQSVPKGSMTASPTETSGTTVKTKAGELRPGSRTKTSQEKPENGKGTSKSGIRP